MLIDPAIRDWVLLPLLALVIVLHFLRLYAMRFFQSDVTPDATELRQKGVVARSQRLRANGGFITGQGYQMRKDHLMQAANGQLNDGNIADKPPNPLAQPDMMKQQLLGMVLGYGPLMWISSFVTGFLVLQIPFPLTERFKQLTQSGIALAGLPSSYVSGLSLYFIASQALPRVLPLASVRHLRALARGFTPLSSSPSALGGGEGDGADGAGGGMDSEEESARLAAMSSGTMMMPGMGGPGGGAPGSWMPKAAFKQEAQALQATAWASALVGGERAMVAAGQQLLAARAQQLKAAGAAAGKKAS